MPPLDTALTSQGEGRYRKRRRDKKITSWEKSQNRGPATCMLVLVSCFPFGQQSRRRRQGRVWLRVSADGG